MRRTKEKLLSPCTRSCWEVAENDDYGAEHYCDQWVAATKEVAAYDGLRYTRYPRLWRAPVCELCAWRAVRL